MLNSEQEPKIDVNSPTWKFIVRWSETQLQAARERNDMPRLDEMKTAVLRGNIRTLKDILELPNPQAGLKKTTALGILSRHDSAGEVE